MKLKKVCLLGASAVGKTSLMARFVHSIFSEDYMTTVGVKVEKKVVAMSGEEVTLVIWDLWGPDDLQALRPSFLRGSDAFLLVADGTRQLSLGRALEIALQAEEILPGTPCVLALNKSDLAAEWEVTEEQIAALEGRGWPVLRTSAKLGTGVNEAFAALAALALAAP